jgi:uncharacterized protein (DUF1778 family)
MKELREATVSGRVTRRVRMLVETAARAAETTVSRLTAEAAEARAREVLFGEVEREASGAAAPVSEKEREGLSGAER